MLSSKSIANQWGACRRVPTAAVPSRFGCAWPACRPIQSGSAAHSTVHRPGRQPLGAPSPVSCGANGKKQQQQQQPAAPSPDVIDIAITVTLFALYAALMAYVFVLSPNQTPTRDSIILEKLLNLKPDEPYVVNQIFANIWNALGIYPGIMIALMIPAARSNKLPVWPFSVLSLGLGCYALIPYMILWSPAQPPQQLPPPESELEGPTRLFMRGNESGVIPALLLAYALYTYYGWFTCPEGTIKGFLQLFDESKLVHASTIDFALFTLLTPFWMANDAEGRDWAPRSQLVPLLSFVPVVGPLIYLLLRPKGSGQSD